MTGTRPRILVTASHGHGIEEYLRALREAGAGPVRIEAGDPARALLDEAAGVLITGGVDVDPASYGASASQFITSTEPERDVLEIDVVRAARELALPTLCVCRGIQIANVAFGGTLIADIPNHLGDRALVRHCVEEPGQEDGWHLVPEHVVHIDETSMLAEIAGATELVTNAVHHQAVDHCAGDLRPIGRTADGIVEAMESRFESPFWLAVQWHPEATFASDPASRSIFEKFVAATRRRATG
ncbi:MAG: putative glutamine amidotransferase [Candidatus Eremiobacteraeota bacterium]|nr:putative glutamine amidotransferase [Candidatus Eremiobacteraeota bacterium]